MNGLRSSFVLGAAFAIAIACDEGLDVIVAVDAGADAGRRTAPDASLPDASPFDGSPVEEPPCQPPTSFEPSFRSPAPFYQGRCSAEQVDALLCVFDGVDAGTCSALVADPANGDCGKCLYTASSSKELGPIIVSGRLASVNVAGCIARAEGNVTDQGCGAAVQALEACYQEACDCNMPVPEGWMCPADAGGHCAEFAPAAACADALLAPDGAAYECRDSGSKHETALRIAKLFCTRAPDASADATSD